MESCRQWGVQRGSPLGKISPVKGGGRCRNICHILYGTSDVGFILRAYVVGNRKKMGHETPVRKGEMTMASVEKFGAGAVRNQLRHNRREIEHSGNPDIDP